jgi:anti-anti-sigma factor
VVANWTLSLEPSPARMVVEGELDAAVEDDFFAAVDAAMTDHDIKHLVLDLGKVDFLDSSGLRALLRVVKLHGDRVSLGPTSTAVRRLLELTQAESAFTFEAPE